MPAEKPSAADVIVLGGGPAGLSLSILLTRLGLSVIVFERSRYERARAGETFGGELMPLLETLGFRDDLQAMSKIPFRGVRSAWGDTAMIEQASIFNPFGEGWHVDRAAFDALLAQAARRSGVSVRIATGASTLKHIDNGWLVHPASGEPVTGRFLVDASGRGARATAAHFPARRWLQMDRLAAVSALMTPSATSIEPLLELEAVEQGWWYSAPQPNGKLLVTLMTDADLLTASPSNAGLSTVFSAALAQTKHIARRCSGAEFDASPYVVRADTGVLLPNCGADWMAIGDAAMGCDPLAGDGVTRALRSAMEAAPMIEQAFSTGAAGISETGLFDGFDESRRKFLAYLELRASYYLRETRFPSAPFWARRQPVDWREAPLFLDPRQLLQFDSLLPPRDLTAAVESLIPPRTLRTLLRYLHQPVPAHQALAVLRAEIPFEDRRLLVGLQDLIVRGIVVVH